MLMRSPLTATAAATATVAAATTATRRINSGPVPDGSQPATGQFFMAAGKSDDLYALPTSTLSAPHQRSSSCAVLSSCQTPCFPGLKMFTDIFPPYCSPNTVQRPVTEQIKAITEKWDPDNANSEFRTYLYNKVEEHAVPNYAPQANEDPKEWELALQQKPGPNYIPVLCAGFPAIIARLMLQRRKISEINTMAHSINSSLDAILSRHDLEHSVRALKARRKHAELGKRALILASRVQVLRNRGYALSGDEDDLRQKLVKIEKGLQDPALGARMEELWSRLIVLRGYADSLRAQISKPGFAEIDGMDQEIEAKAKKVRVAG